MANKAVTKEFVTKVMAAVDAVQADGAGFEDVDEGVAVLMALKPLVDEFKADRVGTGLMLASDFAEAIHDERQVP